MLILIFFNQIRDVFCNKQNKKSYDAISDCFGYDF